jgi:NAD(P)-dependent dehydrogenase (short-subunit alcohol dehydrogenase family)
MAKLNQTARRGAIVTGASSGIGAATAVRLARDGFDVGITYKTGEEAALRVAAHAEQLGVRAEVARLALEEDPDDVERAIADLADRFERLDVLVNNAAVNRRMDTLEETAYAWARTLAINLTGPWICARAAAARMVEAGTGGRIVNVTSVLASAPLGGAAAYCASKAGLEMLTRVLALELAPHAITVNAVAPGHVATPMNFGDEEVDALSIVREAIPAKRPATPEEIAGAIAYLASPEASYVTGASLLVDGGLLLVSGPTVLEQSIELPAGR